ncbi:hypothetical protein [Viridibacterium curvum]|uniref:Uncharacterized protein n=1 Tax=Viridibacterium curvum TaxID=1101404 RepID=A0ABP9QFR8_9RHOO
MQDDVIARAPLNPTHLVIALVGAALIVLGARFAVDALANRSAPEPATAVATAPVAVPSVDERAEAEARAQRQQREQQLIEQDRLLREQKKADALRAREAAAAMAAAEADAKETAWRRFFRPAPKCSNPADDATRIDCSNQYLRARERFEKQYAEGKLQ